MTDREAVIVPRDHGPGAAEQRYHAVLAVEPEVVESGRSPCTALRRLVTANPEAVDWALLLGNRPADGMIVLGAWELVNTGERFQLVCMVVRDADRVRPEDEPLTIELDETPAEVHEFAGWAVEQWARARGVIS
jgi:hypothetical protein